MFRPTFQEKRGIKLDHVVSYSGGLDSFIAAHRVVEKYGPEDVRLFFMDTKTEDEDLYRFLDETSRFLNCPRGYKLPIS